MTDKLKPERIWVDPEDARAYVVEEGMTGLPGWTEYARVREGVADYNAAIEAAAKACDRYDHRHSSGYRCNSGQRLAEIIRAIRQPEERD